MNIISGKGLAQCIMQSIQELNIDQLEYEQELENECDMQKFQKELECYIHH